MSAYGPSAVSKIATRLGFRQLGRFSVEYRKMFGQSLSTTLRLAIRKQQRRRRARDRPKPAQRARAQG
jgi:AraC-like DNA-binding protein